MLIMEIDTQSRKKDLTLLKSVINPTAGGRDKRGSASSSRPRNKVVSRWRSRRVKSRKKCEPQSMEDSKNKEQDTGFIGSEGMIMRV